MVAVCVFILLPNPVAASFSALSHNFPSSSTKVRMTRSLRNQPLALPATHRRGGRPDFPALSADGILAGERLMFRRPLSRSFHFKIGKLLFSQSQCAHSESRQAGNLHVRGDLEQREVAGARFG